MRARTWAGVVVVLFSVSAVSCRGERITAVGGEVFPAGEQLGFPPTWIGYPAMQVLKVHNTSRAAMTFEVFAGAPFAVDADRLEIPGGSAIDLVVRYAPEAAGDHAATLRIVTSAGIREVALIGSARTPPDCTPTHDCVASAFDPVQGACVESNRPDDTPCGLNDACVEDGVCREGVCLGRTLECDDGNACTTDACDPVEGCIHLDVSAQCPAPADPCQVAFCDPATGCGVTDAVDGTACGPADCVTAHVCIGGACVTAPVPDGAVCQAGSPCQPAGVCQAKVCVQPSATELQPVWRRVSRPGYEILFSGASDADENVYWTECSPNAFVATVPTHQACELYSATRHGVVRWQTHLDAWPSNPFAQAHFVTGGLIISTAGHQVVEAHRTLDGKRIWSRDLRDELVLLFNGGVSPVVPGGAYVQIDAIAVDSAGQIALTVEGWASTPNGPAPGGQLLITLDGSTGVALWARPVTGAPVDLAIDENRDIYVSSYEIGPGGTSGLYRLSSWTSSGVPRWTVPVVDGRALAAYGGAVVTAGRASVRTSDGQEIWSAAGSMPEASLVAQGSAWTSWWRPSSGELDLVRRDAVTGTILWRHAVSPGTWLTELMLTDETATLMHVMNSPDKLIWAPTWQLVEVNARGERTFVCDFPSLQTVYGGAVLLDERLVVQGYHPEDGTAVMAFDVPGRRLAPKGWVMDEGGPRHTGAPR